MGLINEGHLRVLRDWNQSGIGTWLYRLVLQCRIQLEG